MLKISASHHAAQFIKRKPRNGRVGERRRVRTGPDDRAPAPHADAGSHRLSGQEIRYLRKHMGLSGKDFARVMGVRPETTSRWENDKDLIAPATDRFLRHLIRTCDPEAEIDCAIADAVDAESAPLEFMLARAKSGWRQATVG